MNATPREEPASSGLGLRGLALLASRSAWHRRFGLSLVVFSIALTALLLLAVERVRHDVREGFSQSVSGADLIIGARGGAVQLLLHTVFRIGSASNNISWKAVQALATDRAVDWVVPLSLGDSHRGFSVVATSAAYFHHFRYGARQPLLFAEGQPFVAVFDAVLGADVARRLGYRLGQRITLAHGSGQLSGSDHDDKPFTVVGILAATGTPVDRSVHISLEGMQAIHLDWIAGTPLPGQRISADEALREDLQPRSVTAALVGLKSRAAVFSLQRRIAEQRDEPLMAVLPGVALDELWQAVGAGERALQLMGALVGVVSLAGLIAVVVTGLEQRRRELAVLRAVGAGPRDVFALLVAEGTLVTLLGAALGGAAFLLAAALLGPWAQARFGFGPQGGWLSTGEWQLLGAIIAAGVAASLLPGWRAYRLSLADGLTPGS